MDFIKSKTSIPIFKQIMEWMKKNITEGTWSKGFKLPSEEDLSQTLGVSRGTVRKAIKELVKTGYVEQIQGKGTFVSSNKITSNFAQEFISFAESMENNGLEYVTEVLDKRVMQPDENLMDILDCSMDTSILYLKRVRYVENEKVILIENWINMDICLGIHKADFEKNTLFEMIEKSTSSKIKFGIRSFEARSVDEKQAKDLSVEVNIPVLFLDQKTFIENEQIVEYSNVLLKSSKHKLVSILER